MTPSLATVAVGDKLPEIRFGPITRAKLALYAGASGDHNLVHIDTDFAKAAGLDDVFAHGMLSMGVLARVVSNWVGPERVTKLSARFQAITPVHAELSCAGEVVERLEIDGVAHLRVALFADITLPDGASGRSLVGEAIVKAN